MAKIRAILSFVCEECCTLMPIPGDGMGPCAACRMPHRSQKSDSAAAELADRGDDGIDFRDKWDPDRDFHRDVSALFAGAHGRAGWTVTYDYPGCFSFRHEKRADFQILATPDHVTDGTIAVDAHDGDGARHLRNWSDIPWPLKDRLYYANGTKAPSRYRAERFIALLCPVLAECEPRKLVVEYDVTGWSEGQIDELAGDAAGTEAHILRSEVVPMEDE